MRKIFGNNGALSVGITRINHTDTSGFGSIGMLVFQPLYNGTGDFEPTQFTTSDITAIDKNGNQIVVNGESDSFTILDSLIFTSQSADRRFDINVSPNPFRDYTIIAWNNFNRTIDFELFNLQGERKLFMNNIEGNFLVLKKKELSPGMYLIIVHADDYIGTRKVIIE